LEVRGGFSFLAGANELMAINLLWGFYLAFLSPENLQAMNSLTVLEL
jgi:hypothetical protein